MNDRLSESIHYHGRERSLRQGRRVSSRRGGTPSKLCPPLRLCLEHSARLARGIFLWNKLMNPYGKIKSLKICFLLGRVNLRSFFLPPEYLDFNIPSQPLMDFKRFQMTQHWRDQRNQEPTCQR